MSTHEAAANADEYARMMRDYKELTPLIEEYRRYTDLQQQEKDAKEKMCIRDRRKLEIARALATNPKLLLLDEPAAGMNPNETEELMHTIHSVRDPVSYTHLFAVLLVMRATALPMSMAAAPTASSSSSRPLTMSLPSPSSLPSARTSPCRSLLLTPAT